MPNLLRNGSFEKPPAPAGTYTVLVAGDPTLKGWKVTKGSVDHVGTLWQPADGVGSVDLTGTTNEAGQLQQAFDTIVGQTYTLRFQLAGNPGGGGDSIKSLKVKVGDTTERFDFDITGRSVDDMGWTTISFDFTATGDRTKLKFISLEPGFSGPVIDDVSVVASGIDARPVADDIWA
jgi:choice-of-anchor C domain-containing protein